MTFFDAKDYFVLNTQRKPEFRQNQFGGTFGGPISISHLYNGHAQIVLLRRLPGHAHREAGKTFTVTVPTAAVENASGFTNLQDLDCAPIR